MARLTPTPPPSSNRTGRFAGRAAEQSRSVPPRTRTCPFRAYGLPVMVSLCKRSVTILGRGSGNQMHCVSLSRGAADASPALCADAPRVEGTGVGHGPGDLLPHTRSGRQASGQRWDVRSRTCDRAARRRSRTEEVSVIGSCGDGSLHRFIQGCFAVVLTIPVAHFDERSERHPAAGSSGYVQRSLVPSKKNSVTTHGAPPRMRWGGRRAAVGGYNGRSPSAHGFGATATKPSCDKGRGGRPAGPRGRSP